MANFKQIKKGNWQVVISLGSDDKGNRIRIKRQGFKTKKAAEIFVTETLDKRNKGFISNDNGILFKDFINDWFNDYKINTIGITTRDNYKSRINNHIIPKLGQYKLKEITNIIIQNFYNNLIKEGMKPQSAKKIMEILNGCFKYAKKNKLIYSLPTEIEKVKKEDKEVEFWSKKDINIFLENFKEKYIYTAVFIDLMTGLRVGELCGLKWKDIDLQNGILKVTHQVIQDKETKELIYTNKLKTKTSYRKITIPKILINYLAKLKVDERAKENDFVLLNRSGQMCNPRNISMEFTKNISKCKDLKRIVFHSLRHTHATLLISNGENIKVVSERLGHKDINTTLNIYTHIIKEMEENTAELLDKMFK